MECPKLQDSETIGDIVNKLEQRFKGKPFLKGDYISTEDATNFEELHLNRYGPQKTEHPQTYRWFNDMKRIKQNWKISKKLDKGTFLNWVGMMERKLDSIIENQRKDEFIIPQLNIQTNKFYTENNFSLKKETINLAGRIDFQEQQDKLTKVQLCISFNEDVDHSQTSLIENIKIFTQRHLSESTEVNISDKGIIIISLIKKNKNLQEFGKALINYNHSIKSVEILDSDV